MPENLGPGEWLTIQLRKNEDILERSDLQGDLLQNSQHLRLQQKHSSDEIAQLHDHYHTEQTMIRNAMHDGDRLSSEYQELMLELQESQDEEDRKIAMLESEAKDYESRIETENSTLQNTITALDEEIKGLEEVQENNIKGQ
ncbi:hypothetical protein IJ670_01370 [bacterium]|nr:hypothetical protein [bacterium]